MECLQTSPVYALIYYTQVTPGMLLWGRVMFVDVEYDHAIYPGEIRSKLIS